MTNPSDVRVTAAALYLLPLRMRVPLKFGAETLTHATCARVALIVADAQGRSATGWGESPLSVPWLWPSPLPYATREAALIAFCRRLAAAWAAFPRWGHPIEIGHAFLAEALDALATAHHAAQAPEAEPLPHLAALGCCAPFDLALHDAYGVLHGLPTYATYGPPWMHADLSAYLEPAPDAPGVSFAGRYPQDYLRPTRLERLPAWHLVGGLDALTTEDLAAPPPADGYPVLLGDWIARDGLRCLKVKLRGTDAAWDLERLVRVGALGQAAGVQWYTADFNCTVTDPAYVVEVLERLEAAAPEVYARLLYVEQPFPYDLERYPLDVRAVSARKPLFLDESAHDWRLVRRGRALGWTGVALKTCKTQTGALLSLAWAKAHGLALMVQDLTNPMLAQIPHVLLAAHAETIMGVETNAMQFYPAASRPEAAVHPGLYQRREGQVDLSTVQGPGLGYRLQEMQRTLPPPEIVCEG
ncbi:MAG: enolase C-terminal domain-like protein [Anaerolineae bacterium]